METLIILFLLFFSEKGRDGDGLKNLLEFYQKNRDLIMMLLSSPAAGAGTDAPRAETEEIKRPNREERGSVDILEEFLKRASV